jgi:hypothetical protein
MKYILTVASFLMLNAGFAQSSVNTLSAKEKKAGWKLLFDGKTTKGWHSYGKSAAGSSWKINNGILTLDTTNKETGKTKIIDGGNLLTNEEYENFHFSIEWKISMNGNSGLLFLVNEDTAKYKEPYFTGPEMQVLDNEGHSDGKLFRHRAGDLYDLINCSKETVKEPGDWNKAEIKIKNGKLDLYLNGVNVVSTMMWGDKWKKMVAKSKFNQWKDFATYKKGHLCLQDHDNMVSYRNIKIRKL